MKAYLNKSLFSEVSGMKFGLDIYVNVENNPPAVKTRDWF